LFKVSVTPKDGGKAIFERIVPADSPTEAKRALAPLISKAIERSGLGIREFKTAAERVTDIA